MAISEREHVEALAAIQQAAFDSSQWEWVLNRIAQASGGWAGQLLGVGPGGVQFNFVSGFSGEVAREFELRGGTDAAINPRARILTQQPGRVLTDSELAQPGEIARSAFFQDFLYKMDNADICLARLPDIGSTMLCACVIRSFNQDAFEYRQLNAFATYLGPIRRAIGFAAALEERGAALMVGAFSLSEQAAILVDSAGTIVGLTPRAESMLRTRGHVLSYNRRLHARDRDGDVALQRALRLACAKPGSLLVSQITTIALFSSEGHPVTAHVAPLPTGETMLRFGPVAAVILKAPDRTSAPKLLQRMYRLSVSESTIAMLIADGLTVEEIALRRQVSATTVRAQLKSIFQKTGIHRQTDLVRMIGRYLQG